MTAARPLVFFFFIVTCMVVGRSSPRSEAAESWQAEWEKTVKAAEEEGQVSLYIAGYGKVIDSGEFQKAYPKIKVVSVTGSGTPRAFYSRHCLTIPVACVFNALSLAMRSEYRDTNELTVATSLPIYFATSLSL